MLRRTKSSHSSSESTAKRSVQSCSDSESEISDSVPYITPPSEVNTVDDQSIGTRQTQARTPEDERAREHWTTVDEFASDISGAAYNILSNRKNHFRRVVAVIVYWENATGLRHLRDEADELGALFRSFDFEVHPYKIPDSETDWNFISTIGHWLAEVSNNRESLFILYYGGHATKEEFGPGRWWKKENQPRSREIDWSLAIKALFKTDVICGKSFIFDCCHAGGMIDPTLQWETSCELLGACAADVQASSIRVSSFTKAVREEVSKNTYDIWELHSALCGPDKRTKYNLVKFPHYQDFMGHTSQSTSALLKPVGFPAESEDHRYRNPAEILARLESMSREAVVCIAVTFKGDAETFVHQLENIKKNWKRWFRFAPTEFDGIIVKACLAANLVAAFNANSCVTIWTFPVWLWDAMAPPSGYQCIGIIHPQNRALISRGTRTGLDVSDYPLNRASLPRSSKPDKVPLIQDTILEDVAGEDDTKLELIKPPLEEPTTFEAKAKLPTNTVRSTSVAQILNTTSQYSPRVVEFESQEIGKTSQPLKESYPQRKLPRAYVRARYWSHSREEVTGLSVGRLKQ